MTVDRRPAFKNLIAFATTRPPCVVFVIFLSIFAFGFLALGYYIQHSNIADTQASKGWNNFYSKLSLLTMCVNGSNVLNKTGSIYKKNYNVYDQMVNISLPVELTVKPIPGEPAINTSQLSGLAPSYLLQIADYLFTDSPIWIRLEPNTLLGPCIIEENHFDAECREMTYSACVTVLLPMFLVPIVKPRTCNGTSSGKLTTTRMTVQGPYTRDGETVRSKCDGQLEMSIAKRKHLDTEYLLSITDKTQLNLRLQLAGYFLFVVLLSFLLYAAIKGRHFKTFK